MRAWQENDTFAFNGQRHVNIWPRPVQHPHPPVRILGGGSIETWQWRAKMDYVYCDLSYYGNQAGQATMNGFWNEMTRLGKDRKPYRTGFLEFVGVADSRQHAFDLYAVREAATNLNVGHLMLLLQFGNISKDLTRYHTKLFADQAMAKLKCHFD